MPDKKEAPVFGGIPTKAFTDAGEEMLKFMKSTFDATFENVAKIQSMNERVLREMIEKGKELQGDGNRVLEEFIEKAHRGQSEYKKTIDDGFKKLEDLMKAAS